MRIGACGLGDERRREMSASVAPPIRTPHSPIRIFLLLLPLLLAACAGGPGRGAPTALPPDVIRPQQPTPIFENSANVFRLTPDPTSRPQPAVPSQPPLASAPAPTVAAFAAATERGCLIDHPLRWPSYAAAPRYWLPLTAQVLERLGAGATVTVTGRCSRWPSRGRFYRRRRAGLGSDRSPLPLRWR